MSRVIGQEGDCPPSAYQVLPKCKDKLYLNIVDDCKKVEGKINIKKCSYIEIGEDLCDNIHKIVPECALCHLPSEI